MKTILVWHETQKLPASVYGDAHFGADNYEIRVCKDPNVVNMDELGGEGIIYHFSGSSSGVGGK